MKNKLLKISSLAFCFSLATFIAVCLFSLYSLFGDMRETKEKAVVPNFVGLVADEIGDMCEIEKIYSYDDTVMRGEVMSQSPAAGSVRKVSPGERIRVEINVSLGKKTDILPNFVGRDSREALIHVRMMGASCKIVDIYGDGEADRVIKTEPCAGCEISEGDEITLYVSRRVANDTVKVPNVLGLCSDEALEILHDSGLLAHTGREGRVMSQSIPPDCYVMRGTEILLECAENEREDKTESSDFYGIFGR